MLFRSKRCAETLFFDYHRQHNLEIKVARIFNTYGPRMHPADGRVVSNFVVQALKDEPITIFGDGQQTRSFCYVEVDQIYNLACPASPVHYQHDPVQTTKTCVHGAINMLGLAKRLRCRILQASTSEVYGDPSVHPQTEDYWGHVNPIGIRSCYDEGKRCAETLFFDYWRQHQLAIKVIRIFNTYGPRMQPDRKSTRLNQSQ